MRAPRDESDPALPPGGARTPRAEIRDLLSFRVHALANALSRGAALTYRREFDVSLMEWRVLALLGAHQPLSQRDLARHAGLDKGQMSRVVSALARRALVARAPNEQDGRGVRLTLSRAGTRAYEGLIAAANRRNDALAAALAPSERIAFDDMVARLTARARELTRNEQAAGRAATAKEKP
ncbi:MAG: MarR family transcriptional regulator [Burkholderiales bacterium]|nr:MarR family transcriptional regulator [Burkholderiales bacterium]